MYVPGRVDLQAALGANLPACSHRLRARDPSTTHSPPRIPTLDATVDRAPAEHPQAQLRRPGWADLRGPWGFAFDDEDRGIQEGWPGRAEVFDREILVPFPPESPASGVQERGYHPVVWYRRVFELPPAGRAAMATQLDRKSVV